MRFPCYVAIAILLCLSIIPTTAQQATAEAKPTLRAAGGHPDLSGLWSGPGINFRVQKEGGSIQIIGGGLGNPPRKGAPTPPRPVVTPNVPSYKPELLAKVKELEANESKADKVFYCGRPGVPRIGPPRKILQTSGEVAFFYEDLSGDSYRIIPTDGRSHLPDANPSYNGDSVGHWEGDTLVVEATNFVEDTWFGESGYFHSAAMRVTERFRPEGDTIRYDVTVEDPYVLTQPWTMNPRILRPSGEALEESPPCVEQDGSRLLNNDHHVQR